MQDHLLPHMCSDKHYADAWFFVAEEDWRLSKEDDVDYSQVTTRGEGLSVEEGILQREARLDELAARAASLSPSCGAAPTSALGDPTSPGDIEFLLRTARPKAQKAEIPQTVKDLVNLATLASRKGIGDLVWYCWEHGSRKQHPGHGSTLIGMSATAARKIAHAMESWTPPGHCDVQLLHALVSGSIPDLRACYIFPSIGHFATHESGCESTNWTRESNWSSPHVLGATRAPAGAKMYFGRFCDKNLSWIEPPISWDSCSRWKTLWSDDVDERFAQVHAQQGKNTRMSRQLRLFDVHKRFRTFVEAGDEQDCKGHLHWLCAVTVGFQQLWAVSHYDWGSVQVGVGLRNTCGQILCRVAALSLSPLPSLSIKRELLWFFLGGLATLSLVPLP